MSSCLSSGGGGRAYRLQTLDLDVIKSPSSTSWISNSSSPSSTLSETSNCPLAISTRKPRTPRKRPNQTYNEAAAILSTAYPKIFPTAAKPSRKFPNSHDHNASNTYSYNYSTTNTFMFEPSDQLLMPFQEVDTSRLLLDKPDFPIDIKVFDKPYQLSPPEIDSRGESHSSEEFDAESILDEEIGGGIESIMGNIELENVGFREPQPPANNTFCYGYPVPVGLGLRRESRAAMRSGDHCDWWRFQIPCVNVVDVTPSTGNEGKQKKKKVEMKKADTQAEAEAAGSDNSEDSGPQGLLLKLNYEAVLNAWSDKASPFSGDSPPSEAAGNDVRARLAQIDLFSDNGGVREASVLRYKEKRRTRLFSKKIRYQVRKVNADRRPRMKGRFVRTPTSSDD